MSVVGTIGRRFTNISKKKFKQIGQVVRPESWRPEKKLHFINPADSPTDVVEKLRKFFFKHSLIYLIICKNSFVVK